MNKEPVLAAIAFANPGTGLGANFGAISSAGGARIVPLALKSYF